MKAIFRSLLLCSILLSCTFAELPPARHTVVFTVDGRTVSTVTVSAGELVPKPDDPSREGLAFGGWCSDAAGQFRWDFGADKVYADLTLTAKWLTFAELSASISLLEARQVQIHGSGALQYGKPASFSSSFSGTAVSWRWYLDESPIGPSSSSLVITPRVETMTYGRHRLSLFVTDADGLVHIGSLPLDVTN